MDVRIGLRDKTNRSQIGDLILGSYLIRRNGGPSLLTETCEMKLEIQRNLDAHLSRIIPDIDVRGLLSTVRCSVDEEQYKLIRGLLAFNLGENLDYLQLDQTDLPVDRIHPQESKPVWSTLKLRIDLVNVILDVKNSEVRLAHLHYLLLMIHSNGSIQFIRSHFDFLKIHLWDSFSVIT